MSLLQSLLDPLCHTSSHVATSHVFIYITPHTHRTGLFCAPHARHCSYGTAPSPSRSLSRHCALTVTVASYLLRATCSSLLLRNCTLTVTIASSIFCAPHARHCALTTIAPLPHPLQHCVASAHLYIRRYWSLPASVTITASGEAAPLAKLLAGEISAATEGAIKPTVSASGKTGSRTDRSAAGAGAGGSITLALSVSMGARTSELVIDASGVTITAVDYESLAAATVTLLQALENSTDHDGIVSTPPNARECARVCLSERA
jgi:hypothetical protein